MSSNTLAQTDLFQMNLMIWLSQPSHAENAIFYKSGYDLYMIEGAIPTPNDAVNNAARCVPSVPIKKKPNPDILLRHRANKIIIPLECKLHSFYDGPYSDSSRAQAAALLASSGEHIARTLGFPIPANEWESIVHYAVSHDDQTLMTRTLDELTSMLDSKGVASVSKLPTSFGIEVREGDGIYLHFCNPERTPLNVANTELVMSLPQGRNPQILYLIPGRPYPTENTEEDKFGQEVLAEMFRATFAQMMYDQLDQDFPADITIVWEELLENTILVWKTWQDQSKREIIRPFRDFVKSLFQEFDNRFGTTTETSNRSPQIVLRNVSEDSASKIGRYLNSKPYKRGEINISGPWQLTLDDNNAQQFMSEESENDEQ